MDINTKNRLLMIAHELESISRGMSSTFPRPMLEKVNVNRVASELRALTNPQKEIQPCCTH